MYSGKCHRLNEKQSLWRERVAAPVSSVAEKQHAFTQEVENASPRGAHLQTPNPPGWVEWDSALRRHPHALTLAEVVSIGGQFPGKLTALTSTPPSCKKKRYVF